MASPSTGDISTEFYRLGGPSLGGAATGLIVAVASSSALTLWGAALLGAQQFDVNEALRGDFSWSGAGVAIGFVAAVFVSFLWGGYAAGRMGVDSGAINGLLVAGLTVVLLAGTVFVLIGVADLDSFDLPFDIGSIPLDGNFTAPGLGILAAIVLAIFGGAMWGGVNGSRWHLKVEDEVEEPRYRITGTDSFSDLRG